MRLYNFLTTSGFFFPIKLKENIPIIAILCNPGIRKRHWDAMSQIAGKDLTPDSGTSLAKMLQLNLDSFMEQFASISSGASKEFTLETNMNKMHDDWTEISFNLIPYRESGIFILASVDDIQQMLDDQISKTQTMRGSPFIKPFEKEIKVSLFRKYLIIIFCHKLISFEVTLKV